MQYKLNVGMDQTKWKPISSHISVKTDSRRNLHLIWIQNSVKPNLIVEIAKKVLADGVRVKNIEFRVAEFTEEWVTKK